MIRGTSFVLNGLKHCNGPLKIKGGVGDSNPKYCKWEINKVAIPAMIFLSGNI